MFKLVGIIFGAALFLAGCATAPPPGASLDWSSTKGVPSLHKVPMFSPTNKPVLSVVNSPPPFANSVPFAKTNQPAAAPIYTWTSLNHWTAEKQIGAPHKLSDSPVTTYAIGSSNGVMVLEIGSHEATWNGLEINLGFEPQMIDGEIFVHGLDLKKNLEPLLCASLLTFGTNRTLVIDPGHGGANVGTHSVLDGRFEKEFTLDWARRLKPLLETNGWKVFLTRIGDMDVSLSNRVAFAEARRANLFISLHFNSAAPDKKQAGLETYCLTPTGMPSTLTRGYPDLWSENLPNNNFDVENLLFAVRLQHGLLRGTGLEDRGVRRARFIGVLRGQKRPAILIEAGYLSNPHEAALIENPDYRQKLAEAVANALK